MIVRPPILSAAVLVALSAMVVINALSGQNGRHPAPFAASKLHSASAPSGYSATRSRARTGNPVVAGIQRELSRIGSYGEKVDGLDGPVTRTAIADYQRNSGLPVTGEPSQALLDHLLMNRRIAEIAGVPAVQVQPTVQAQPTEEVRLIQKGLAELGYDPGPADGVVGGQTRAAILQFQRDRALDLTGTVTPELIRELRKVTGISVLSAL